METNKTKSLRDIALDSAAQIGQLKKAIKAQKLSDRIIYKEGMEIYSKTNVDTCIAGEQIVLKQTTLLDLVNELDKTNDALWNCISELQQLLGRI